MVYWLRGNSCVYRARCSASVRLSSRLAGGWCRSGRTEQQALEALAGYAGRYAAVATGAGLPFAHEFVELEIVERALGNVTTDVGAPAVVAGGRQGAARRNRGRSDYSVAGCSPASIESAPSCPLSSARSPRRRPLP